MSNISDQQYNKTYYFTVYGLKVFVDNNALLSPACSYQISALTSTFKFGVRSGLLTLVIRIRITSGTPVYGCRISFNALYMCYFFYTDAPSIFEPPMHVLWQMFCSLVGEQISRNQYSFRKIRESGYPNNIIYADRLPFFKRHLDQGTATAGSDVVQSGRSIFDDFFQHLWPHIGNNTANVVFQMVKRLWLIRIDQ
ncbi:hypothetical protein TNCV_506081 [Trichonephila clavipes]|nr:hypothetical protein TNCV_506081 [Trichonephila clavipes]